MEKKFNLKMRFIATIKKIGGSFLVVVPASIVKAYKVLRRDRVEFELIKNYRDKKE